MVESGVNGVAAIALTIADRWEKHEKSQREAGSLYRLLQLETNQNLMQLAIDVSGKTSLSMKQLGYLVRHLETDVLEQVYAGASRAATKLRRCLRETPDGVAPVSLLAIQALAGNVKVLAATVAKGQNKWRGDDAENFLREELLALKQRYLDLNARLDVIAPIFADKDYFCFCSF
mmetsp:Transcript_27497/g.84368  ORF Transcript_27497/g.84368 Transcript_27497/m.84368 type:complete len:175 (-) Transcript_27497:557-1081(-)